MENKHNFTGIIIPIIVAVILLTVLPIINSMNVECPPCEECPSYNIGNVEVNPNFSSGNYIVDKGSYDYIDSATIIKDIDLIPENIKKDVNIFGVVGTYEDSGSGLQNGYVYLYVDSFNNGTYTLGGITIPEGKSPVTDYGIGKRTLFIDCGYAEEEEYIINVVSVRLVDSPIYFETLTVYGSVTTQTLETSIFLGTGAAYLIYISAY